MKEKKIKKSIKVTKKFLLLSLVFVSSIVLAATVIKYNENNLGASYKAGGWKGTEGLSESAYSKLMSMNAILRSDGTLSSNKQIQVLSSRRGKKSNGKVGGAKKSKHLTGDAFDIWVPPNKRHKYYMAARQAGFGGFGFKSTVLHIDTRGGFQYWCYRSSDNNGSKEHCKGTKKQIAEEYLGVDDLSKAPPTSGGGGGGEPSGGYEEDSGEDYGIDLKKAKERLDKEIKNQLAEICSREGEDGGSAYGLVGYGGGICDGEKSGFEALKDMVQNAINWIIKIAFLIAVLAIFWSGFLLLTANGDISQRTRALKIFRNVIIGLFFIAAAFLLVDWFFSLFNIDDSYKFTSHNG